MLSNVMFFNITDDIKGLSENIQRMVDTLRNIKFYILNPSELISLIWDLLIKYSKPLCLIVCFAGFLIYLIGIKKGAKIATGSILAYTIIKIFDATI